MTHDQKARAAAVAAFRKSTYDALTLDECHDAANAAIDAYLAALPLPPDVEAVCERLVKLSYGMANDEEDAVLGAAALIRTLQARLSGQ